MANVVTVTLIRAICNDMDSSVAEHDHFSLSGAVVVDGKTIPFAEVGQGMKTGWTFSYHRTLFQGWVEQPTVGLGAIGLDIDNSDWWVRNEEDVRKITSAVSKAASFLPIPYLDKVIDAIPGAVELVTGWDEDDVVFRWAQNVELPPLGPGVEDTIVLSPRTSSETAFGIISDSDYTVEFAVTWQVQYPSLAGSSTPTVWTSRPLTGTLPAAWPGWWESESAGVTCIVTRNPDSLERLDVRTTEASPSETQRESATIGARISGTSADLLRGVVLDGAAPAPAPTHPDRGDRVQLSNGCILEIREAVADGQPTGVTVLRYAGPGSVDDPLTNPPIDVELGPHVHIS